MTRPSGLFKRHILQSRLSVIKRQPARPFTPYRHFSARMENESDDDYDDRIYINPYLREGWVLETPLSCNYCDKDNDNFVSPI
jgi:hypothetical protein